MSNERIFLSPPHIGDEERGLVTEAFDINFIAPVGPHLNRFEAEVSDYTGFKYCAALSSGTAAMHLALKEAGVGPGDEVIASTLTFIASVSPVTFLGAKPVFIDCDASSWNMDPTLLAEELAECAKRGSRPKAVIPTDLYGQPSDLDAILATCKPYDIPVIVDSAEAMGARYKDRHAGKGAHAAIYSFNGNKIITTGGGGILASDDEHLIRRARHLATQAREDAPWYEHTEIGFNYRLSNVAAAIGIGQMHVLNERVNRKREICERYREQFAQTPAIEVMPESEHCRSTRWLTVIQIDPDQFRATPEQIRLRLEEENIESRPVWKPMHLQPVFKDCRFRGGAVSEKLFARGLCLPSGTKLTNEQIDAISQSLLSCAG
jgi:dTDP-4-amino-4,6-dideoxygalactose transaminase